jgi:hypothetical protein
MKNLLVALLVLLSTPLWALTPTQTLARAIAKTEGFGVKGTIPTRYRNPGDIRASRGARYPGQVGINKNGYVIFRRDTDGWAALEAQIGKIIDGTSRFYTVNDTLRTLAKKYATSPTWLKNVAKNLHCEPNTPLFIVLDTPPAVTVKSKDIDFLFQ